MSDGPKFANSPGKPSKIESIGEDDDNLQYPPAYEPAHVKTVVSSFITPVKASVTTKSVIGNGSNFQQISVLSPTSNVAAPLDTRNEPVTISTPTRSLIDNNSAPQSIPRWGSPFYMTPHIRLQSKPPEVVASQQEHVYVLTHLQVPAPVPPEPLEVDNNTCHWGESSENNDVGGENNNDIPDETDAILAAVDHLNLQATKEGFVPRMPKREAVEVTIPQVLQSSRNYLAVVVIEGATYGSTDQLSFQNLRASEHVITRISPSYARSLVSKVLIKIQVAREMDEKSARKKVNPLSEILHTTYIEVFGQDMTNIKLEHLDEENIPESVRIQNPRWRECLGDRCIFSFDCANGNVHLRNKKLPSLATPELQRIMDDYIAHVQKSKNERQVIKFAFIVRTSEQYDAWSHAKSAFERDSRVNPMTLWVKNAKNTTQLTKGNLLAAHECPPLDKVGLIIAKQFTFRDCLHMQIAHAYCEQEKHVLAKRQNELLLVHEFQATMSAVPASRVMASPYDNNLPKCYLSIIDIRGSPLEKPAPGDMLRGTFRDFTILPPAEYRGPNPKPERAGSYDVRGFAEDGTYCLNDDESDDEDGDNAEFKSRFPQEQLEYEKENLQTMTGTVVRLDRELPPGHVMVIWYRPVDFRFRGPIGCERRVDTDIPSHDISTGNKVQFFAELAKAPRHRVSISKNYSGQYFKDVIRCLGEFCKTNGVSDERANKSLARYLLRFDPKCGPDNINYLKDYAPKDWSRRIAHLTQSQQHSLIQALYTVCHGFLPVHGVVASTKTYCSVLICVLPLARHMLFQSILVSGTNKGADSLALIAEKEVNNQGIKGVLIIRLGSFTVEKEKFTAKTLPPRFLANMDTFDDDTLQFTSQAYMNVKGLEAETFRKRGNLHFTERCRNLYLHEAMAQQFQKHRHERQDYMDLNSILIGLATNYSDTDDITTLKGLLKTLMNDTLASAHIITTTPAQAIRNTIHSVLSKKCFFLLDDEGGLRTAAASMALLGAYNPKMYIVNGDLRQPGPYDAFLKIFDFWAPFKLVNEVTILKRSHINNVPNPLVLNDQLRMYTPTLTSAISKIFYQKVMVDANKKTSKGLSEVQFMTAMHRELYQIENNNFCIVETKKSRHKVEEGSTSLYNPNHLRLAMKHMKAVKAKFDTCTDLGFDAKTVRFAYLSWYRCQVDMMQAMLDDELKDSRFFAMTVSDAQGETVDFAITDLVTGGRISQFVGDPGRLLVAMTRHRYGLTLYKTFECTEAQTYNKRRRQELGRVPHVKTWVQLFDEVNCHKIVSTLQC